MVIARLVVIRKDAKMRRYVTACIETRNGSIPITHLAAWAAGRLQAPLKLVHVLDDKDIYIDNDFTCYAGLGGHEEMIDSWCSSALLRSHHQVEQSSNLLNQLQQELQQHVHGDICQEQYHGQLVETLNTHELEIRTLVVGKSGQSIDANHQTVGHQIESLLRTFAGNILLAPRTYTQAPNCFMFAFDGSSQAEEILEKVVSSPMLAELPCHLVMVNETPFMHHALIRAQERLHQTGFTVTTTLLRGSISEAIAEFQTQQHIPLLVMGAYGHSRLHNLFFGSHTNRILNQTDASVLVLR